MLKKTTEISGVFKDKKREEVFQTKHKVGINSFTRVRKLGFTKIMTMIIKKSNKSLQNSINDTQLALGEDVTISNSAYTQARVSCLFDVLNSVSIDSCIMNKNSSKDNDLIAYDERTLAMGHFEYCNDNDIVIMDRGYPSFELFAAAHNKTKIVCRIRINSFSKAKFLFAPHSEKM